MLGLTYRTLCHLHNVQKFAIELSADDPPATLDTPALRDTHTHAQFPTHILVILDTPALPTTNNDGPDATPAIHPILIPVNAELFADTFEYDLAKRMKRQVTTLPVPQWNESTNRLEITLRVTTLQVSHPPSIPLLLLFGFGEQFRQPTDSPPPSPSSEVSSTSSRSSKSQTLVADDGSVCVGLLSTYLLPIDVIEEFPAPAAMAQTMAQTCTNEEFEHYLTFNRGLWQNILVLSPKDQAIMGIVGTAWNVTREAQRIRKKMRSTKKSPPLYRAPSHSGDCEDSPPRVAVSALSL